MHDLIRGKREEGTPHTYTRMDGRRRRRRRGKHKKPGGLKAAAAAPDDDDDGYRRRYIFWPLCLFASPTPFAGCTFDGGSGTEREREVIQIHGERRRERSAFGPLPLSLLA